MHPRTSQGCRTRFRGTCDAHSRSDPTRSLSRNHVALTQEKEQEKSEQKKKKTLRSFSSASRCSSLSFVLLLIAIRLTFPRCEACFVTFLCFSHSFVCGSSPAMTNGVRWCEL